MVSYKLNESGKTGLILFSTQKEDGSERGNLSNPLYFGSITGSGRHQP
jgi:hypothetical protein